MKRLLCILVVIISFSCNYSFAQTLQNTIWKGKAGVDDIYLLIKSDTVYAGQNYNDISYVV
jgi:hypothetical protein